MFGVVVVFGVSELLRSFGELRLVVAVLFVPNGIAGTNLGRRVQ